LFDKLTSVFGRSDKLYVIYLDFHKAFDEVPHRRLVSKLDAHGIGGEILKRVN